MAHKEEPFYSTSDLVQKAQLILYDEDSGKYYFAPFAEFLKLANLDITVSALRDALIAGQEYTTPTHTAPSIGTTSTIALASNAGRLYALLINDSDETIYLKLGVAAVANEGIRLNANGGNYEMSKKLGNLYTGVISAICASGGKKLLILEGV